MKLGRAFALALTGLMWASPVLPSTRALDGNALLRESARRHPWPQTYSVPIHFNVKMHRPIPIGVGADAIAYFKQPDRQALVITSLPRVLARRVAGAYSNLDTVPQAWPLKYRVTRVESLSRNGERVYELHAVPNYAGVRETVFDLLQRDLSPVSATWFFTDGSLASLTVRNGQVGRYALPLQEEIEVSMPRFELHASGQSGAYTIDSVLPDKVFASR